MRGKVIEVTATGNISLYTPRKIFTVVIQITWRLCKADLYVDDITDRTVLYHFFHFLKVGEIAAVICDETGNTRFLRNTVDTCTLLISDSHWFFNIGRLACFHSHNGVCSV